MFDSLPLERGATATRRAADRVVDAVSRLLPALRAAAFWLAIGLPVVYLPLFLVPLERLGTLLLVVHALAVVAGYDHEPAI